MKKAAVKHKAPMPEIVDLHATEYQALLDMVEAAKLDATNEKAKLVKLAAKFGDDVAAKSMRLLGLIWQITASFGTSSSVDEEVVEKIRIELALALIPSRVMGELFHQRTSHVVAPTAPAAVKKLPKKIQRLFARVMVTKPKEPSLKVEKLKKSRAAAA